MFTETVVMIRYGAVPAEPTTLAAVVGPGGGGAEGAEGTEGTVAPSSTRSRQAASDAFSESDHRETSGFEPMRPSHSIHMPNTALASSLGNEIAITMSMPFSTMYVAVAIAGSDLSQGSNENADVGCGSRHSSAN